MRVLSSSSISSYKLRNVTGASAAETAATAASPPASSAVAARDGDATAARGPELAVRPMGAGASSASGRYSARTLPALGGAVAATYDMAWASSRRLPGHG